MAEISPAIMQQLAEAQAALMSEPATGPPVMEDIEEGEFAAEMFGAAGSGQAAHVLVDHHFTSSARRLWAHAGGAWRHANIGSADEAGIAQVAFLATRTDAWWDASNKLTILRCWKSF
jgi:hypothetical protein